MRKRTQRTSEYSSRDLHFGEGAPINRNNYWLIWFLASLFRFLATEPRKLVLMMAEIRVETFSVKCVGVVIVRDAFQRAMLLLLSEFLD